MNPYFCATLSLGNTLDLLTALTDNGNVYSYGFCLNMRVRTNGPRKKTYTIDTACGSTVGIKATFYYEDGAQIKTKYYSPVLQTDLINHLNADCDVLVRTLNKPLHFRRGGENAHGHDAVLEALASLSMPAVPKCDLVMLINALAHKHALEMVPSHPWDDVPSPASNDQDFSMVADPEGEMLILRMARGTWILRLDQEGVDRVLSKLGIAPA